MSYKHSYPQYRFSVEVSLFLRFVLQAYGIGAIFLLFFTGVFVREGEGLDDFCGESGGWGEVGDGEGEVFWENWGL